MNTRIQNAQDTNFPRLFLSLLLLQNTSGNFETDIDY